MASKTGKLAQSFLNQLASQEVQLFFETLLELMSELEVKDDPEPTELRLIENIYHTMEKLKIMEGNLRSYSSDSINEPNISGKLANLYDGPSYGTSKLFKK